MLAFLEEQRGLIAAWLCHGAGTGHCLLERLFERPIILGEGVRTITGVTYAATNGLVRRLVEHGILVEITGHRRHRPFRYDLHVRLFEEPPSAESV